MEIETNFPVEISENEDESANFEADNFILSLKQTLLSEPSGLNDLLLNAINSDYYRKILNKMNKVMQKLSNSPLVFSSFYCPKSSDIRHNLDNDHVAQYVLQ